MIEQRKARRFDLKLPFELIRARSARVHLVSETRNISSIGVLFVAEGGLEVSDPIEYIITLPTGRDGNTVKIRCLGKIVRLVGANEVGATLERYEFLRTNKAAGENGELQASGPKSALRRKAAGT